MLSEYGVWVLNMGMLWQILMRLVYGKHSLVILPMAHKLLLTSLLASAETKWKRMNGVVMLLPHGYEGQGPEHSSAQMERFLQMCAELNMVVTNITTAANFFHALRRQLAWPFRKPLVNFSPKANLRHAGYLFTHE